MLKIVKWHPSKEIVIRKMSSDVAPDPGAIAIDPSSVTTDLMDNLVRNKGENCDIVLEDFDIFEELTKSTKEVLNIKEVLQVIIIN